jgi:hypothetical protein
VEVSEKMAKASDSRGAPCRRVEAVIAEDAPSIAQPSLNREALSKHNFVTSREEHSLKFLRDRCLWIFLSHNLEKLFFN